MLQLPPIPTWDSMHVLIIHFPIALLLLSPLFILIAAILSPSRGKPYMLAALIILMLGTSSLFISASTGHAAAQLAERGGAVDAVLKAHEDLASETQIVFTGLTIILLGMYLVPKALRREENRLFSTFLSLAFLALYTVGILFLVNTAHAGGRLVHEFGVHALVPATGEGSEPVQASESSGETAENH